MIFSKLTGIFTFNNNCARALVELGGGAHVGLPVRCKSHNSKQPIHDWWLTSAQMLIWHCDQSSQHIYMSAQKWIWHSAVSNQSTHQTNQHIKPNNTLKTFNSYRSAVPAPYQTRFMNTTHTVHFYSQPAKYPLRSALGMEALKQDSKELHWDLNSWSLAWESCSTDHWTTGLYLGNGTSVKFMSPLGTSHSDSFVFVTHIYHRYTGPVCRESSHQISPQ